MTVLALLAEPWFVIPWYAFGALACAWVIYDEVTTGEPKMKAMRWAWPIITFFFSVIGLVLYLITARGHEETKWRKVVGAVIHCVAGDGLGLMTAMVIARATGMSFWQEFWFEYAVGFAFGWFIFQLASMKAMTDSIPKALAMAFRAETFSMMTVMGGMGAVMTYVTPAVVGAQPKPLTFAFWGFGMLGLVVGFIATIPMNWMLVEIGWKKSEGKEKKPLPVRGALLAAMVVLGAFALVVPAYLTEVRERPRATAAAGEDLAEGTRATITEARDALARGDRHTATEALDALRRLVRVGDHAAPDAGFATVHARVRDARRALQDGDPDGAARHLDAAEAALRSRASRAPVDRSRLSAYDGATIIDAKGRILGELEVAEGGGAAAVRGARDVWGFFDLTTRDRQTIDEGALLLGPAKTIGPTMVVLAPPPRRASAE